MTLRVVGAGLPRTGTASLKAALERLLGRPCYHMMELIQNLEHVPIWHAAVRGDMPDWPEFLSNYGATVGESIAYGYLPIEYAVEGTQVDVMYFSERLGATVTNEPRYDPSNATLRG